MIKKHLLVSGIIAIITLFIAAGIYAKAVPDVIELNDPAYAPSGTFTWNGTTLAGIGLSALTTTPTTVWTITEAGGSGDTIQFALAPVPEPSTTALLGLGGLALILRRRK